MVHHFKQHFVDLWHRFIHVKDRPHAVAGGMAIGVFFGFMPPIGFKTVIALGVAYLVQCNPIAAVLGVTLHDLFLWIWPLVWRWEFQVGHWLLSNPHAFAHKLMRSDFNVAEIMHWENFIHVGLPLLVGASVIGIPFAFISYLITLFFMLKREQKKEACLQLQDKE